MKGAPKRTWKDNYAIKGFAPAPRPWLVFSLIHRLPFQKGARAASAQGEGAGLPKAWPSIPILRLTCPPWRPSRLAVYAARQARGGARSPAPRGARRPLSRRRRRRPPPAARARDLGADLHHGRQREEGGHEPVAGPPQARRPAPRRRRHRLGRGPSPSGRPSLRPAPPRPGPARPTSSPAGPRQRAADGPRPAGRGAAWALLGPPLRSSPRRGAV